MGRGNTGGVSLLHDPVLEGVGEDPLECLVRGERSISAGSVGVTNERGEIVPSMYRGTFVCTGSEMIFWE